MTKRGPTNIHLARTPLPVRNSKILGNESVPIQLAQCWFPGLAISNAKMLINFSNITYGSNFIIQHSKTVMV